MLNKKIVIIVLLIVPFLINAQKSKNKTQRDTLYVYETVTVYDTIFVYDTIKTRDKLQAIAPINFDLSILQFDSLSNSGKLLLISKNRAATIPINSIIVSNNKNINQISETMRKISFFGVVLFAFQSMVMAQTNVGITAGYGMWWNNCSENIGNVEISPVFHTGLFAEFPIANRLTLESELNYHYLTPNGSYKAIVDTTYFTAIGDGESASAYHQLSLPVKIGYHTGNYKPYIGAEFSYRMSERWLKYQFTTFSVLAGFDYQVTENLSLGLSYTRGLTNDMSFGGTIINPETQEVVKSYNNYWKSSRAELSLHYTLNHRIKKE